MQRNAKRTEYGGRMYASKLEAHYAAHLDLLQRAGIVIGWEPQVRLPLLVPGPAGEDPVHVAVYTVDFIVHYANGKTEAVETKGFWTDAAKLRRRLFEATWLRARPAIVYRVLTRATASGEFRDEAPPCRKRRPSLESKNRQVGVRQRILSAAEGRELLASLRR